MKRSGFKKPTYEEALKKQRKAQVRRATKPKKPRKKKSRLETYKPPKWYMKLPVGSHGQTPAQKRFWKLISDTYRKADWEQYDGKCVSCGKKLEHWKDGDLGHFKKHSVCNSWFKFQRENLALQCKGCNMRDDGMVGYKFGEELKRRYHKGIIEWIEETNKAFAGQKIETWDLVERAARLRPDLVEED